MRAGPESQTRSIALLGAPGTDAPALAARLRTVLRQHPEIELCTPPAPEAGLDLVLLMGLAPAGLPSDARAAQIAADNALRAQLLSLSLPYRVVHGQGEVALDNALLALGLPAQDAPTQTAREQAQFDLNRGRTPWSCEHCSDPACEHRLFTGLTGLRGR